MHKREDPVDRYAPECRLEAGDAAQGSRHPDRTRRVGAERRAHQAPRHGHGRTRTGIARHPMHLRVPGIQGRAGVFIESVAAEAQLHQRRAPIDRGTGVEQTLCGRGSARGAAAGKDPRTNFDYVTGKIDVVLQRDGPPLDRSAQSPQVARAAREGMQCIGQGRHMGVTHACAPLAADRRPGRHVYAR